MKLFLDANVLLDGYYQRAGVGASDQVIALCDGVGHSGWIAWHTLSNVFYLVRGHSKSSPTALQFVSDLLAWADVAETGKADALHAVGTGMSDFEDALQLAAALVCEADIIVTRNTADFKTSPLPVMTPEQLLAHLASSRSATP
jgi:predicted nucleic acid-binding protein